MPAAVAAGIGRAGAAFGRSAVRVGTQTATTAKKILTSKETQGQHARTVEGQRQRLLQGQRQARRARIRESETLGTMSSPMLTGAGQRPMDLGGGISTPERAGIRQEPQGFEMSPETQQQRPIPRPLIELPATTSTTAVAPGEATEKEIKDREARETVIEWYLQVGNLVLASIDLATLGAGLLITLSPHLLLLARWNVQLIVGDIIWKGKHKYIGGLKYRGGWSVLQYLDSDAMGLKALVIILDLALVLGMLIAFMMMFIMILAALSPII